VGARNLHRSLSGIPGGDVTIRQPSTSEAAFAELMGKARQHDEEAVVTLYRRALPVIYRYVLAHLGQPDLAEDVVSDVFLVMVESIEQLRTEQEAGFYAWLLQIAQRKVARVVQQQQHQRFHQIPLSMSPEEEEETTREELADHYPASDPIAVQEWQETIEELQRALDTLSQEQQIVVTGRFLADQSIEDLAQALNKRPGAIRALQFRALGKLAKSLGLKNNRHQEPKGGSHAT
jgi:RNA polymerase sigma factor (sigma-70 family)